MKVCCLFSLELLHRGDSNEYTQYIIFNIYKKNYKFTLNYFYLQLCDFFPRDSRTSSKYRIYPKYSDTVNVWTPSFFLKRHQFYVPYISGHVPSRVFLLPVNVWTPKTCPLVLINLLFFTTGIFCIFALFTCVSG